MFSTSLILKGKPEIFLLMVSYKVYLELRKNKFERKLNLTIDAQVIMIVRELI